MNFPLYKKTFPLYKTNFPFSFGDKICLLCVKVLYLDNIHVQWLHMFYDAILILQVSVYGQPC